MAGKRKRVADDKGPAKKKQKSLEEKLNQHNISEKIYQKWHNQLKAKGYTDNEADTVILKRGPKSSVEGLLATHDDLKALKRYEIVCCLEALFNSEIQKDTIYLYVAQDVLCYLVRNDEDKIIKGSLLLGAHGEAIKKKCTLTETTRLNDEEEKAVFACLASQGIEQGITHAELIKIAKRDSGNKSLTTLLAQYMPMRKQGVAHKLILQALSHDGGSKNLEKIRESCDVSLPLKLTTEQISEIVKHDGGSNNLVAIKENYPALRDLGFTDEQIIKMASHAGGAKNLVAVKESSPAMQLLGFTNSQIFKIANRDSRSSILYAIKNNASFLSKLPVSAEQLINLTTNRYRFGNYTGPALLEYFISQAKLLLAQHQGEAVQNKLAIEKLFEQMSYCNLPRQMSYYKHPDSNREDTGVVYLKNQPRMLGIYINALKDAHSDNNVAGEEDALMFAVYGDFVVIENLTAVFETLGISMDVKNLPALDEASQKVLLEHLEKHEREEKKRSASKNKTLFFSHQLSMKSTQDHQSGFSVNWAAINDPKNNSGHEAGNDEILNELSQFMS